MPPLILSTRLPVQILHRPISAESRDWNVEGFGPGNFTFPGQEEIGLRLRNIDDEFVREMVAEFRTIPNLVMLNLSENRKVTDKGIRLIQPFSHLQELNLSSCDLSNKGLEFLTAFKQLKSLNISYCNRITGEGLLVMRKLTNLVFLDLQGVAKINTGDIARIRKPTLIIHRP